MEWWEKEYVYERIYESGRQATNLYKYIPEKVMDGVEHAFSDSDGYWIWLEEGWTAYDGGEDCRIIHCYNIKDLKEDIKTIRREN